MAARNQNKLNIGWRFSSSVNSFQMSLGINSSQTIQLKEWAALDQIDLLSRHWVGKRLVNARDPYVSKEKILSKSPAELMRWMEVLWYLNRWPKWNIAAVNKSSTNTTLIRVSDFTFTTYKNVRIEMFFKGTGRISPKRPLLLNVYESIFQQNLKRLSFFHTRIMLVFREICINLIASS